MKTVENYSQKNNSAFSNVMARRTAEKEGAFFLKHLKENMQVLDVGCGPGTITLGFAQAVEHGTVIGVDFQAEEVERAQILSAERGITNLEFKVANAYQLPFADRSFDAVFGNALLWHLSEPQKALAEMKRVLKPGGIVGVRECDWGARIHEPMTETLKNWYDMTLKVRRHNAGNPHMGRGLSRLLLNADFERVEISASVWSAGTSEEIKDCSSFLIAQLQGFAKTTILPNEWMSPSELDAVVTEIELWSNQAGAFYMETYCEALGRVND